MDIESNTALFVSSLVRIEHVVCTRAIRGLSCEECKTEHQIAIPLSGVNVRHVNGRAYTISPSHATLSNREEEYKVSHPYGSGETQLNIILQDALLADVLRSKDPTAHERPDRPFLDRQLPVTSRFHLGVRALMRATQSSSHAQLELEEITVALVEQLLGKGEHRTSTAAAKGNNELAQRAQAMLASHYAQQLTLQAIASELGTSVFHLCRSFKKATNATLWSQVQKLRTRAALTQLADGARDLTGLGLSLGFSHHSHFTAAFRREMGLTPSAARQLISAGSLAQVRQLLAH
jgi:AraC family transcriptional regulator